MSFALLNIMEEKLGCHFGISHNIQFGALLQEILNQTWEQLRPESPTKKKKKYVEELSMQDKTCKIRHASSETINRRDRQTNREEKKPPGSQEDQSSAPIFLSTPQEDKQEEGWWPVPVNQYMAGIIGLHWVQKQVLESGKQNP